MARKHKALVTILIGESYQELWRRWFADTWERYAEKHGYDLIVIDQWLDDGPRAKERSANWQKLLILEHPMVMAYDHAVWVDADILINPFRAPCIVEHAEQGGNADGIGLVTQSSMFHNAEKTEYRWDRLHQYLAEGGGPTKRGANARERNLLAGLPDDVDDSANTGVMVLKPRLHGPLLRHVYEAYDQTRFSASEEKPLAYEILKRGLANPLDPRFNQWWIQDIGERYPFLMNAENRAKGELVAYCVNAAWHNCFFMHFVNDGATREHVRWVVRDRPNATDLVING